jgi:hypothetical protein
MTLQMLDKILIRIGLPLESLVSDAIERPGQNGSVFRFGYGLVWWISDTCPLKLAVVHERITGIVS